MNLSNFVDFIKTILLIISSISIINNFIVPCFYILFKNYKIRKLKDKNIQANINH
ncbi:putative membrane protein [Candidatus Phytoplasma solani]